MRRDSRRGESGGGRRKGRERDTESGSVNQTHRRRNINTHHRLSRPIRTQPMKCRETQEAEEKKAVGSAAGER